MPKLPDADAKPDRPRSGLARRDAALRMRFETGESLADLARTSNLSLSRLKVIAKRDHWKASVQPTRAPEDIFDPSDRRDHALRDVMDTVRLEIRRLRLEAEGGSDNGEKIARTLASLTRSLDKASSLEARRNADSATVTSGVPPYDVDELRRSLADKLDRFRRGRIDRDLSEGT